MQRKRWGDLSRSQRGAISFLLSLQLSLLATALWDIYRLLLIQAGAIPYDLVPFLDRCAERIFLHKVGGGYLFTHRLLMEHVAPTPPSTPRWATTRRAAS